MTYFVVRSEQGPAWNPALGMREQPLWEEHRSYINRMLSENEMLLGGPIRTDGPYRAMIVVLASSATEVRARLAEDPWYREGVLREVSIENWDIIASNDLLDPPLAEIARLRSGPA